MPAQVTSLTQYTQNADSDAQGCAAGFGVCAHINKSSGMLMQPSDASGPLLLAPTRRHESRPNAPAASTRGRGVPLKKPASQLRCPRCGPRKGRCSFRLSVGAGEGNRTLVFSLEGCCSTIELHPQRVDICMTRSLSQGSRLTPPDSSGFKKYTDDRAECQSRAPSIGAGGSTECSARWLCRQGQRVA